MDDQQPGSEPGRLALIADDDTATRVMIRAALEGDGWSVEEAEDGLSAYAKAERSHPDILLLDVEMPELDGFDTCARVRALADGDHLPVLMITGMDDQDSIRRAYDVGATDFLAKPINFTILRQRVQYMYRATQAASALRNERDFVSAVIETAGALVLVLDPTGQILRFNEACQRALGYSPHEVTGRHIWDFLSPRNEKDRQMFNKLVTEKRPQHYEGTWVTKSGAERVIAWSNTVLVDGQGRTECAVCTGLDVTAHHEAEEKARFLTSYDPLTGLPNRRLIVERIDQAIAAAAKSGPSQLAVLFLDLDRFKNINTTLGHAGGDVVMKAVTERLTKSLRLSDVLSRTATRLRSELGRLGGDEFTILLTGVTDANEVAGVVERLQHSLRRPFIVENSDYAVTATVGAALFPSDGSDAETLVQNAASAMHAARQQDCDSYHFYSATLHSTVSARVTLETELRKALDREELVLHYQPKVSGDTKRVVGAEALVRWQHPSRGLILPGEFVQVAEETGLIVPLGEWVLRAACDQMTAWFDRGLSPVPVAVNLSSAQFRVDSLLETVVSVLNEGMLDPTYLELEVTESMIMRDEVEAREILSRLGELGVRTAIDDFGTGHSTLGSLKSLPVHTLKIDQGFIKDLGRSPKDLAIVRAVIAMAHGLDLQVVAEGVESSEHSALLAQEDCDVLQGFLFSPPVPAGQFTTILQDDRGGNSKPASSQLPTDLSA